MSMTNPEITLIQLETLLIAQSKYQREVGEEMVDGIELCMSDEYSADLNFASHIAIILSIILISAALSP